MDETKDTPITILSAGVAELVTRSGSTALEGTANAPVSMGIFIAGGSEYNYQNVKYTHNGTYWTGETMLYEGVGSAQQIYAYYPYVEGVTGTIEVTASEQKDCNTHKPCIKYRQPHNEPCPRQIGA